MSTIMTLKILLPSKVFAYEKEVLSISAEALSGSFGLLPRRLDCVAALAPGILSYQLKTGNQVYLAIDQGILIKIGPSVVISVHNSIGGSDLKSLKVALRNQFIKINDQERSIRSVMAKMESSFLERFAKVRNE